MLWFLYRDASFRVPENNLTDAGEIGSKKIHRPATSMTEVLIGLFMFFLGIISLMFLAFYMYSRILNSGSKSTRWKKNYYNAPINWEQIQRAVNWVSCHYHHKCQLAIINIDTCQIAGIFSENDRLRQLQISLHLVSNGIVFPLKTAKIKLKWLKSILRYIPFHLSSQWYWNTSIYKQVRAILTNNTQIFVYLYQL